MKLFKNLLVAPAALGFLAPVAVNANEVNLNEMSAYSNLEGLEVVNSFDKEELNEVQSIAGQSVMPSFEAGGFSETTTASFSADFAIGSVEGTAGEEAITTAYGFQIDLSTSFTGEDSFDVSLDAGEAGANTTLDELDLNSNGETLAVDGISYTFPVGAATVFVGDNMDGSTLYSTACVYGGVTNTLDDCGNGSSAMAGGAGTAAGASFDIGSGFTAAIGYTGDGTTEGLMSLEGLDTYGGQLTYTGDSFGASVTYADVETSSTANTIFWGFNGYYTPESSDLPSISVGYEIGDPSDSSSTVDTEQWFVGLQWDEMGPGTLGLALGTNGAIEENAADYYMYEAFYSYPVNDGMTITPLIYVAEGATDSTGIMVKTSFSF